MSNTDLAANDKKAVKSWQLTKPKLAAISEILFILLPFIVSALVFLHRGEGFRLLIMPEWSIAASVLFGQSIVKAISAIMQTTEGRTTGRFVGGYQPIAAFLSVIIVVFLVPSLLILSFVMNSTISSGQIIARPSNFTIVIQLVLFIISLILFFGVIAISDAISAPKSETSQQR